MDTRQEKIERIIASIIPRKNFKRFKTVQEMEELIDVWNRHRNFTIVAKELGVSLDAIRLRVGALRYADIDVEEQKFTYNRPYIRRMLEMQQSGLTTNKIAKITGVSWITAARYIKRPHTQLRGIMAMKPYQLNIYEANVAHLIDLKRAGYSPTKTELNIPRGIPDYLPTYMEYAI